MNQDIYSYTLCYFECMQGARIKSNVTHLNDLNVYTKCDFSRFDGGWQLCYGFLLVE